MREGYVGGRDGFNERSATALRRQLDGMVIDKPVVPMRTRKAVHVKPALVGAIVPRPDAGRHEHE